MVTEAAPPRVPVPPVAVLKNPFVELVLRVSAVEVVLVVALPNESVNCKVSLVFVVADALGRIHTRRDRDLAGRPRVDRHR